ncbi:hypothetical protein ACIRSS_00550 [Amycolatopsis sp. NPDC101161]|uniref:hypothetical protein n=1 Tax=Amycolatopsis sp. NPDC101161 TaxID=3363940 RepID=UPI0038161679
MRTVLDLNRFKLYESLHLKAPRSSKAERKNNAKLMNLLSGDEEVDLRYEHPAADTAAAPANPPGNP